MPLQLSLNSVFNVFINTFSGYLSSIYDYYTKELPERRNLIRTLQELRHSIRNGDLVNIKKINERFHQNLARNKELLSKIYARRITQSDLILAACQNKRADILYYLLKETDILFHLPEDSFSTKVLYKQRIETMRHVMRLKDFDMVEMLYDFWCGNFHWSGNDVKNIEMVGLVFQLALGGGTLKYVGLQLGIEFWSLVTFNEFQCEIYPKLAKLKNCVLQPKETVNMLLDILFTYDEYSCMEKVRIKSYRPEDLDADADSETCVNDDVSSYNRIITEIILYEKYFRKLDFYVSWLIIENLYVIRKHLKTRFNKTEKYFEENPAALDLYENAVKKYREIEAEIYHFIYRTSEDWRLYDCQIKQFKIRESWTLKMHLVANGSVIYFERKRFKKCLHDLKAILEEHVISDDPAVVWMKNNQNDKTNVKNLLNENYLQTVSYMRDHYSLLKIVYYIEAIENTATVNVIIIERVLHVVGEMLKSTDDSHHLSRSTQALLQTAISVETVRHLQNIRNFLSHTRGGELSARIHMANIHTQALRFEIIKKELIMIKRIINPILQIYKSILDKSLLEKGFRLLEQRLKAIPEAKPHFDEIRRLKFCRYGLYSPQGYALFISTWRKTGLSYLILYEIASILENKARIYSNILKAKIRHNMNVVKVIPLFIQDSKQMLNLIIENNMYIKSFNEVLTINEICAQLPDFPDTKEIGDFKTQVKKAIKKKKIIQIDLTLLNNIKNYKDHWKSVKGILSFCLTECELFAPIKENLTDTTTPTEAFDILTKLEDICAKENSYYVRLLRTYITLNKQHFIGIESLHNDQINSIKKEDDPRKAREELISCLINRLDLLKQTLLYPQKIPLSDLVRRFDHDVQFRIIIEMLLADIANVLAAGKIKLMYKSSKLLRDIDLGNVLDHGNPFLEVIGDMLNSHDLAAELLDKAMMFAEDAESIEALYELFKGKMDYKTILAGDLSQMNDQQKKQYTQYRKSSNWKYYALLARYPIPKSTKTKRTTLV